MNAQRRLTFTATENRDTGIVVVHAKIEIGDYTPFEEEHTFTDNAKACAFIVGHWARIFL